MPRVFIPPLMQPLVGGREFVDAQGTSVRQVITDVDRQFPGVRERLCEGDDLKPGLTVAVDGRVSPIGLMEPVKESSEIHFLPAIGGG